MKKSKMTDDDNNRYRYAMRLLIRHPTIDPNTITKELGLAPVVANHAGSQRVTPTGTVLPGVYNATTWGYSARFNGGKYFYEEVRKLIFFLEPHKHFLSNIVDTGGAIDLIVNLPGDINMGDLMIWQVMAQLVTLKVNLGVEVFPDFN